MVSAPPLVAWRYCVDPLPHSHEARMLEVLQQPPRMWAPSVASPSATASAGTVT